MDFDPIFIGSSHGSFTIWLRAYMIWFKIWFLHSEHGRIWFFDAAIQPTLPAIKQTLPTCGIPCYKRAMVVVNSKVTEIQGTAFTNLDFDYTLRITLNVLDIWTTLPKNCISKTCLIWNEPGKTFFFNNEKLHGNILIWDFEMQFWTLLV